MYEPKDIAVPSHVQDEHEVAFVERAFDDAHRVLSFRVLFSTFGDALEALRRIGHYNTFDGHAVAKGLLAFFREHGRGIGANYTVSVGREGSPVLYLRKWGLTDNVKMGHIVSLAHALKADEVTEDEREYRLWWD